MATKLFLLPLFLHVLFVFWIGTRMLSIRMKSIRNGSAKIADIATNNGAWPRKARQFGNNFDNQFDTPMLWYSAAGLVVALQFVDMFFVGLSWMFLFTRVAHTFVHIGDNHVPSRMRIFVFGYVVLIIMWMLLGLRLFILG